MSSCTLMEKYVMFYLLSLFPDFSTQASYLPAYLCLSLGSFLSISRRSSYKKFPHVWFPWFLLQFLLLSIVLSHLEYFQVSGVQRRTGYKVGLIARLFDRAFSVFFSFLSRTLFFLPFEAIQESLPCRYLHTPLATGKSLNNCLSLKNRI